MQKFSINVILLIYFLPLLSGCSSTEKKQQPPINDIHISPTPAKILYKRGYFELTKSTRVLLNLSVDEQKLMAEELIEMIVAKTGHKLKIADQYTTNKVPSGIELTYQPDSNLPPEGFELNVGGAKIKITAADRTGMVYAFQLLVDLLNEENGKWMVPQLSIEDRPYRATRAIRLQFTPTMPNSELIGKMISKRINYLFMPAGDTIQNYRKEITIGDNNKIDNVLDEHFLEASSIPELNELAKANSSKGILFTITDPKQLDKDSLQLIENALWASPESIYFHK